MGFKMVWREGKYCRWAMGFGAYGVVFYHFFGCDIHCTDQLILELFTVKLIHYNKHSTTL